jgi:hypothetical protein
MRSAPKEGCELILKENWDHQNHADATPREKVRQRQSAIESGI